VDDEVVGPGLGVHRAGLAERGSHAVDKDDISKFSNRTGGSGATSSLSGLCGHIRNITHE
jgi:hypothetical protein